MIKLRMPFLARCRSSRRLQSYAPALEVEFRRPTLTGKLSRNPPEQNLEGRSRCRSGVCQVLFWEISLSGQREVTSIQGSRRQVIAILPRHPGEGAAHSRGSCRWRARNTRVTCKFEHEWQIKTATVILMWPAHRQRGQRGKNAGKDGRKAGKHGNAEFMGEALMSTS